jgi:hypothetical protein
VNTLRFVLAVAVAMASVGARAAETPMPTTLTGSENVDFDRPEAWAMKYLASTTLMTSFGPPRDLRLLHPRLGFEAGWIPSVSDEQRTVGFNGTKKEDMNKLPIFARLRLSIGLPWKLSLTLGYVPPIPINHIQANLFAMSLGRPFTLRNGVTLGVAAYGQVGSIDGDITCPQSAVNAGIDPDQNPFGCTEKSHDEVNINYFGVELSGSYRIRPARNLEPYMTIAANYMDLGFRVNAVYGGTIDHTVLKTQGATYSMTGGLLYPITRRLDIATEVFYSPLTVTRPQNNSTTTVEGLFNVRGLIAYRF